MLEYPSLAVDPPGPGRAVHNGDSGERVGFVLRKRPRWYLPPADAIYEVPDESLVGFVGRNGWFGPLVVADAEGQPVAVLRGRLVLTADGYRMACRVGDLFVGPDGTEMATIRIGAGGTTLTFLAPLEGEPLVRMALLASVLRL